MTHVSTDQLRKDPEGLIRQVTVEGERIVLRIDGKDVAAIVPLDDLALIEQREDEEDLKDAIEARKEIEKEGTVPWETVKKRLGL